MAKEAKVEVKPEPKAEAKKGENLIVVDKPRENSIIHDPKPVG